MFNIFRVKTKLQLQVEAYKAHRATLCPWGDLREDDLQAFVEQVKHVSISEITLEEIEAYYQSLRSEGSKVSAMTAIRGFMRFHKREISFKPDQITNQGVIHLQPLKKPAIIAPMIKKRTGRPYANVDLIKQIKRLKDKEGISFRKIGVVVGKDVSHVYRMYRYNLTNF